MRWLIKGGGIAAALFLAFTLTATLPSFHSVRISRAGTQKTAHAIQKKPVGHQAVPVSWDRPSGGSYPVLKKNEQIWIDVSVKNQRVYIKKGQETLYTMIASTGLDTNPDTTTPTGTYYVQAERGKWFYSPKYKEGAEYWVSWKNHGEFLFHSVPMDENRHILAADAAKLGQKDSHGCIHLTVPDAKWIYEHIPYDTKVVIHS
ncbi:L,D-transpeptidase [Sporolactobacillus sp. CPB3-1]|uniref:L,D-transpeptidase n=1 Tax=Sporolactobacillus mangiferae TaxID=2940498 RepID=A0ABT0M9R4_9BACL|nr:L,D-transpeptidase [Sporolactobacillus mangiferae]MCL1631318.1 L,D-transpeptidase [Sporolactobacillus mangiferae]